MRWKYENIRRVRHRHLQPNAVIVVCFVLPSTRSLVSLHKVLQWDSPVGICFGRLCLCKKTAPFVFFCALRLFFSYFWTSGRFYYPLCWFTWHFKFIVGGSFFSKSSTKTCPVLSFLSLRRHKDTNQRSWQKPQTDLWPFGAQVFLGLSLFTSRSYDVFVPGLYAKRVVGRQTLKACQLRGRGMPTRR